MVSIVPVTRTFFMKPNLELFVKSVYHNFYDIAHIPKLKHNPDEIKRLLLSKNFRGLIISLNKKIIGYLLGELHYLADGRFVFFINYLYVAKEFRKHGLGSRLMDNISVLSKKIKVENIVLNCDTNKKHIYDFYLKRGFMPDMSLRTYDRYEVLSMRT
jgi:ribosomal protein S18 acetylase RimI-like enzyme